ncbi:MAG: radical SAM/SPASM domain-containing protein [Spirochaetae bacterium HGW-Spirochaetae-5]|nr:MAG: radical SAM/SPASM domain-containing protein [Spirochaetae bacterium HGW-Spirochaetae-5]
MIFSKHNILGKLAESENWFILNALSGNADILTPEKAREIEKGEYSDTEEYITKGYLVDETEENRKYKLAYLDFIEERDNSEIQIFFVPRYECNFACLYCYQDEYAPEKALLTEETVDAFFKYVDNEFRTRKKYVTVFGGEPLLPGEKHRSELAMIIEKASAKNIDLAIVTNGYNLIDYLDILSKGNIREIQVTLDGTKSVHDSRRYMKNKGETFDRIVEGIDESLKRGFSINLRMVTDKDNVDNLPDFASFAIERGWTGNPLFKTQIGRNYELHHCMAGNKRLFERAELYEKLYELVIKHPHILEFHKPLFSVSKFLSENGELPRPLFDSCPACKSEWAFDYTGKIYSCTATVGKAGEELGTFFPGVTAKDDIVSLWQERDVTSIPECGECSSRLLCGGGCGAVAKNRTGNILSTDCRPVKPLLEMGLSLYFNKGEQI